MQSGVEIQRMKKHPEGQGPEASKGRKENLTAASADAKLSFAIKGRTCFVNKESQGRRRRPWDFFRYLVVFTGQSPQP